MDNKEQIAGLEAEIARLKSENDQIKSENAQMQNENAQVKNENAQVKSEIARLKLLNDRYLEMIRLAQHRRFGASSEKTILVGQLGLFNEVEVLEDPAVAEPKIDQVITYTRRKQNGKREELYADVPTEQVVHELPEDERVCPACGGALHACGHAVLRRELELIPAKVRAVEHVQTMYACRHCERNADADKLPVVKSSVPAPVIAGSGLASPSLLSFIMCNKFVLALPLYRQEQELNRIGIHISRQTMANWVIYAATRWLTPLYELLHAALLRNDVLHADETTLQVIREDGRSASQQSYMWMYHTGGCAPNAIALFEYQATREAKHPLAFLAGYEGFLHVDAYAGYRQMEAHGVTLVECWAHVRRKFDEVLKTLPKNDRPKAVANIGLSYCNQLFALERQYDSLNIDCEERSRRRNIDSRSVVDAFFTWAESIAKQTLPRNKFSEAITYALNQQQWLRNFLLDGRLELSNNRAENSIRPFTVGRKNWLFSYSAKGAKASAVAYSIIETAQANGLLPFAYLDFLFQTLPNIPPKQYAECLPWNPAVQQRCKAPRA